MRNNKGQFTKQIHSSIVGLKYGQLTVIKDSGRRQNRNVLWECLCACGNTAYIVGHSLKSGNTISCGCLAQEYRLRGVRVNPTLINNTEICLLNPEVSYSHNTSGVRGVSFDKKTQKYRAYIQFQKKLMNLGFFESIELAAEARKTAEEKYYKPTLDKYNHLLKSKKH